MAVASWAPDPDERLPNEVHFPISCDEWSQRQFGRATTLLHSLWYAHSESTYAAIIKHEADCLMAYWASQ